MYYKYPEIVRIKMKLDNILDELNNYLTKCNDDTIKYVIKELVNRIEIDINKIDALLFYLVNSRSNTKGR